ncbi:MAG: glycosyltransferase family 2 protein [Candidatus Shapirobacteria bacterium]|nr:glycosyltransferase family 2 protein [Candidatus Shapirobacteria bacterium]
MKIAIIVPEYNEGIKAIKTIKNILRQTKNPIIVIDDGSVKSAFNLIVKAFKNNQRVTIRRHVINLGKGAAMKTGVELAWKLGYEAVIFVDADGQHNPKRIKQFEKKLETSQIVFGYRLMNKSMPVIRRWGNKVAANLVRVLFNIKKKDLLSGFLGFRKEVYPQIEWSSCRYGIETEMATKIGKNKLKFSEIKIDTIYIDKYKGVTILDALKILLQIPFWYFTK